MDKGTVFCNDLSESEKDVIVEELVDIRQGRVIDFEDFIK